MTTRHGTYSRYTEGCRCGPCRAASTRARKTPAGRFSHATHCVHGHEFTPENTRLSRNPRVRSGVERVCLTCRREHNRKQAARRKAARALTKENTNGE